MTAAHSASQARLRHNTKQTPTQYQRHTMAGDEGGLREGICGLCRRWWWLWLVLLFPGVAVSLGHNPSYQRGAGDKPHNDIDQAEQRFLATAAIITAMEPPNELEHPSKRVKLSEPPKHR